MAETFADRIAFALKALSMSRARLAADLGVDKSVVGRWITGAVQPSAHNLALLSALLARRVPGFTALDWDRDMEGFAALFGVVAGRGPVHGLRDGLPLPFLAQALTMTAHWGASYEGFYRSTRPYAQAPGRFIHDQCMVRRDGQGLLRLSLANTGVFVDGWLLPLREKVFIVGTEFASASLVFGILNGVSTRRVERVDGLILSPIHDAERTPTATAILLDRIGDLSGDTVRDDALFSTLAAADPRAPEGSIPPEVKALLLRDIGPEAMSGGGDLLLRMPPSRSLSRGEPLEDPWQGEDASG